MDSNQIQQKPENGQGDDQPFDYLKARLDDIVFRYRNKAYGAYFLRQSYPANMVRAFFLALGLMLLLIFFKDISKLFGHEEDEVTEKNSVVELTQVDLTRQMLSPPPPPPPPPAETKKPKPSKKPKKKPANTDDTNTLPIPQKEEEVVEPSTETTENTEPNSDPNGETVGGKDKATNITPPMPEAKVVVVAEQMPSFPGGKVAMYSYIFQNIRYPVAAREKGVVGTVFISFIVEKDGSITNVEIRSDIGGGCGQESARIVKAMPKWAPGKIDGRFVRVKMTLPIDFKLIDIN